VSQEFSPTCKHHEDFIGWIMTRLGRDSIFQGSKSEQREKLHQITILTFYSLLFENHTKIKHHLATTLFHFFSFSLIYMKYLQDFTTWTTTNSPHASLCYVLL